MREAKARGRGQWRWYALLLLVVWVVFGTASYHERQQISRHEGERLLAQARIIDANLTQQLRSTERVIRHLAELHAASRRQSGTALKTGQLKIFTDALPGVRALGILDAEGNVLVSSRDGFVGRNFANRSYFSTARQSDGSRLMLSAPYTTLTNAFVMNLTRDLRGEDGSFQGVVTAALDPSYFSVLLRSVNNAPGMAAGVAHGDGMVFMREPPREGLAGKNVATPGTFFSLHQASGRKESLFSGIVQASGEHRMIAVLSFQPADLQLDKSLEIAVSRELQLIYAEWRATTIFGALLLTFLSLGGAALIGWLQRRQNVSEQNFRSLVQGAPYGIALLREDGVVEYYNPAFTRITGYSLSDVPSVDRWFERAYPDPVYRAQVVAEWQAALRGAEVGYIQRAFRVRCADGRDREIQFMLVALQDRRSLTTFEDITDRVRSEMDVRETAERLQHIFDAVSSIAVQGYSPEGVVRYWNPASERLYGYSPAEAFGRSLFDLIIPPAMREPVRQAVGTMISRGEGGPAEELLLRHKDGHPVPVLSSHVVVRLPGHEAQLYCLDVDLTQRKVAETALASRESLLRQVMDTASVAIFLVDSGGRITFANQRMAEMFACPMERLLGSEYVAHVHPDERDAGRQKMLALLASKVDLVDVERLYWRDDHSEFWGHLTGQRFHDLAGNEVGLVGVIADIDQRRRAETALRESEASERAARQRADAILAALPDLLLEIDQGGLIVDYRAAPNSDLHAAAETLVGRAMTQVLPAEMLAAVAEAIEQASRNGHYVGGTYALEIKGEQRWFEISASRRASEGGPRFLLLAREVTQRKAAEAELAAEQGRFRDLVDSTSGIVWEGDARSFDFTYVSQEAERLLGYPVADWLTPGFWVAHLHPDDQRWAPQFCAAQTRQMAAHDFEYRFIARDGRTVWLRDIVKVVAEAGQPRWLRGVMIDITESKRASQRHAGVVASSMDGFVVVDAGGTITECNDALCAMTAYSRRELLALSIGDLDAAVGREEMAGHLATIVAAGRERFESRWRRQDGAVIEIEVTASFLDIGREICAFVRDITKFKQHQRELDRIAHYDPLTGIPNRTLLADRMAQGVAQTRRTGTMMAFCYLDLDGFKPINDQYGHEAGDRVLVEISERLKACLRSSDTVARMGGDEFVLLLLDQARIEECEIALARILKAVAEPMAIDGNPVTISASLGVAIFPRDDADVDTLLRHADQAMYLAKQSGKNRYHLFDPENDRVARDRSERLARIRTAIDRQEFVLFYQPQVNMRRGVVQGVEALIRWQHPERGLLPPADFLSVIEDTDLVVEIGDWVIATALRQIDEWKRVGIELCIGVNIAPRHLLREDFVPRLQVHLANYPSVNPRQLDLEVLETAALEDIAHVSGVIRECRTLGVSFSLDDFGTGYSSLTYLKSLPAETLKIDQTFVRDMLDDADDRAIVRGVIGLAKVFQRQVIAEGVETVEHGSVLLALGCELAQGYGIARPMPVAAVAEWVANWQPDAAWRGVLAGTASPEQVAADAPS